MLQKVLLPILVILALTLNVAYAKKVTQAQPVKEGFLVESLPFLAEKLDFKQYAGLLEVDKDNNGHLFFWMFEAKNSLETAPLVIWLTGGAGCSSAMGLFLENGPFKIQSDSSFLLRPYSWNENATVLYLDQPVGTGFSYTDQKPPLQGTPDEVQHQIGEQFYNFLLKFYSVFPEYKTRPLFITGESFAGNYIPHIAAHIVEKNKTSSFKVNLGGLMLGAAWVYPLYQYKSYTDYAYGVGLIEMKKKVELDEIFKQCEEELNKGEAGDSCYEIRATIMEESGNGAVMVDSEDMRHYITYTPNAPFGIPNTPPELDALKKYMNKDCFDYVCFNNCMNNAPDYPGCLKECSEQKCVIKALHATASQKDWKDCSSDVINSLQPIINNPTYKLLPSLLNEGMPILISGSQYDFVINHLGIEQYLRHVEWTGLEGYLQADRHTWSYANTPAGYYKTYKNLTYIMVIGAGHMGPYDKPGPFLDMLNRFISGKGFQ